jgi:hypothetical protein
MIVGQYDPSDLSNLSWINDKGEKIRFEDMLRYEMDAPIEGAPCGGTHRLFDLAWVRHLHLQRGGKDDGVWQDIAEYTRQYQKLAKQYRNMDGSFSVDSFRGRNYGGDLAGRINTTGHIFEWLALSLPYERLQEGWVEDAAVRLSALIMDCQSQPIDGGSLYHAAHGLRMYHARVFDRSELGKEGLALPLPPGEPTK